MKSKQLFTDLTANEQENLSGGTLFLLKYLFGYGKGCGYTYDKCDKGCH